MSRPVVFIKRINLLAHLRSRHLLKANGLIETHAVFIVQIVYWPSTVCKPVTIALKKSFFYTFLPHLQRGVQPCSRLILFSRFPRSCLFVEAAECTWSSDIPSSSTCWGCANFCSTPRPSFLPLLPSKDREDCATEWNRERFPLPSPTLHDLQSTSRLG